MLELDINVNYNKILNNVIIPFPTKQSICEILQRTSSIYPRRLHVRKLIFLNVSRLQFYPQHISMHTFFLLYIVDEDSLQPVLSRFNYGGKNIIAFFIGNWCALSAL